MAVGSKQQRQKVSIQIILTDKILLHISKIEL